MTHRAHVPLRTCMGCGERDRRDALLRVVRLADGTLLPDARRRQPGRGGYLHEQHGCLTRFSQRKGMVRSWRAAVDRPARAALTAVLTARGSGE